jgi:RND family efflux transporter MFP subunit
MNNFKIETQPRGISAMIQNLSPLSKRLFLLLFLVLAHQSIAQDSVSAEVEVATITSQNISETISTYGILAPDPDQVLSLSLPHSGLINRVWVRLGQKVRSGDPLLEVITSPEARMQFLQAQSAVDFSKRELERLNRLLSEQLATKSQVAAGKKNLTDANSQLKALIQRGQGIDKEVIRAPMDGIITRVDVSQGQRIQADSSAMLIAAKQKLIARLGVEPEDVSLIKIGTSVNITSVFVPNVTLESTVREIHGMINPQTHLVEILVEIPENQADNLALGSRLLGRMKLTSRQAFVVPRSAVLGFNDAAYIYTIDNQQKAQKIFIKAGEEIGDLIEISGELKAGEKVVTSGNYVLEDGMNVRIINNQSNSVGNK